MTPHDLSLEETGYTHARLNQPITSANPHYCRGYRQGEGDSQNFQNFQNLQGGHAHVGSLALHRSPAEIDRSLSFKE
jgi:hypothetical protein